MERPDSQRDVVLYLPDRILVVDQDKRSAWRLEYDFTWKGQSTAGLSRAGPEEPYRPIQQGAIRFAGMEALQQQSGINRASRALGTDINKLNRAPPIQPAHQRDFAQAKWAGAIEPDSELGLGHIPQVRCPAGAARPMRFSTAARR